MPICEKCWKDSFIESRDSGGGTWTIHKRLHDERNCTPEEQAGENAPICPVCERRAVHYEDRQCVACGCYLLAQSEREQKIRAVLAQTIERYTTLDQPSLDIQFLLILVDALRGEG